MVSLNLENSSALILFNKQQQVVSIDGSDSEPSVIKHGVP